MFFNNFSYTTWILGIIPQDYFLNSYQKLDSSIIGITLDFSPSWTSVFYWGWWSVFWCLVTGSKSLLGKQCVDLSKVYLIFFLQKHKMHWSITKEIKILHVLGHPNPSCVTLDPSFIFYFFSPFFAHVKIVEGERQSYDSERKSITRQTQEPN